MKKEMGKPPLGKHLILEKKIGKAHQFSLNPNCVEAMKAI
jgi:hypothetical protein